MARAPEDGSRKPEEEQTLPVIEERLEIQRRRREAGTVRVRIVPKSERHRIDEEVIHDEVDVTRVPVERWVDAPERERYEDGKIIVPVHRELMVVERRLQVFEEIHIAPKRRHERKQEDIVLHYEEVVIEREEGPR
jgi:stress response protein YsnF